MSEIKPTVGLIGAGITGSALAIQLSREGYKIVSVNSRTLDSSRRLAGKIPGCLICNTAQQVADSAKAVFLTVPDDKIAEITANITWHSDQIVIHCSGVHSTDILQSARRYGASVCCMHPLQTFASIDEAVNNIRGSTFTLEGDDKALAVIVDMATALKGNIIKLKPSDKVLYHAAAVILSNYLITLMKMATDLWQHFGISQDDAVKYLLPLLKGTLNNIEKAGIPYCLTGPIARGDIGTVQKHLTALKNEHPEILDVYRILGLQTIDIALAKGRISIEIADNLRAALEGRTDTDLSIYSEFYKLFMFDYPEELSANMDKVKI
jgi:predicted short-subunit dehydrogenase-like oxidoreductase (DUF2520 family)